MNDKPNYYAIIPANVRYDEELKASEKLLYAEITALANSNGYCFATNAYFAKLYKVHKNSVCRWISNLCKKGYIYSEIIYDENKIIEERRLYITPINKNDDTPINENVDTPINKNVEDNNTSINNIYSIFDYWNSKLIIVHKKITPNIKKAIEKALKQYEEEEIKKAIDSYKTVLDDEDFYYKHKWSLEKFLKQNNGISRFTSDGDILNSYLANSNKSKKEAKKERKHKGFEGY